MLIQTKSVSQLQEVGPGDSHIKAGYSVGALTYTVKVANVSFEENRKRGLPVGSGFFVVNSAVDSSTLGIFLENRYLTDLRTGAAGAVAVKHFTTKQHTRVAFIGTGAIATAMAEASHCVHQFEQGYAYGIDKQLTQAFANDIHAKLGYRILVCDTAEEAIRNADVIFTQTPGKEPVLKGGWLKPHATIIASGSDQATKNELPVEVLKHCKLVTDLTSQCKEVGELRTGIELGNMTVEDVYAELGEAFLRSLFKYSYV